MKQYLIMGATALILLSSCGASNKDKTAILNDKKTELGKLKADKEKIDDRISALQTEIDNLDTAAADAQKAKLVTVQTIQPTVFDHYIKLQGRVDAQNISYIAPRGNPGLVTAVYIKQGDHVRKGQLLLKLDDAVIKQSLTAAQQGLAGTKTQLALAKNIYERKENLWKENIGTEVDVITAKSNVANLEDQLKTQEENVQVTQQQLNTTNIISDVEGIADIVNVKVGETFQGVTTQGPQIEIVNNSELKAKTTVPQNYLSNVKKGSDVVVFVPDINKKFNTTINFISASIDPATYGFPVEAKLPVDASLKPNQVAEINIKDYSATDAIVVPVETLQNDLTGKFILVAVNEKGKLIARKRPVTIGMFTNDKLEVKSGLKPGDVLITQGFQGLYDGQMITTR